MRLNQVTAPAKEIAESVAFYRLLGLRQIVSSPHYARFECPGEEAEPATFSIHLHDAPIVANGTVIYFECDDLDEHVRVLQTKGIAFEQLPRDEPWQWREARLRDPSGNEICLYFAGANRRFPDWRIPDA
jgi:catechol 2,3-dioxygenase-like lactoylglutathione lyase family enzyme